MTMTQDFTAKLKDMMGAYLVDTSAFDRAFETSTALGEKMTAIGLGAATDSADISTAWTMETLARLGEITKVKSEPADYATAMTEFASAQMQGTVERMSAFAEVARKAQTETAELMMSMGKDFADDMTAAAETAAAKTTEAAKTAGETATEAAKPAATAAKPAPKAAASTARKTTTSTAAKSG